MARRCEPHPFNRARRLDRHLSRDDIGNQGRLLLSGFISDRMRADGYMESPSQDMLIEPGTPSGPPVHHLQEVACALRRIGDELDNDAGLQRMIQQITPDCPEQTFLNVAKEIFRDGNFNWGRVVALFYFAYKMVVKAIQKQIDYVPLLKKIIEWVVTFIIEYVAPWIIERGGWEAVQEYFGATTGQMALVICAATLITAYYVWKFSRS